MLWGMPLFYQSPFKITLYVQWFPSLINNSIKYLAHYYVPSVTILKSMEVVGWLSVLFSLVSVLSSVNWELGDSSVSSVNVISLSSEGGESDNWLCFKPWRKNRQPLTIQRVKERQTERQGETALLYKDSAWLLQSRVLYISYLFRFTNRWYTWWPRSYKYLGTGGVRLQCFQRSPGLPTSTVDYVF